MDTLYFLIFHQLMEFYVVAIFLAIMNIAAMNICVQVFVRPCVFNSTWYIASSRAAESYGNSIFNILRNYLTVFL